MARVGPHNPRSRRQAQPGLPEMRGQTAEVVTRHMPANGQSDACDAGHNRSAGRFEMSPSAGAEAATRCRAKHVRALHYDGNGARSI
jgi:hypothetical protein